MSEVDRRLELAKRGDPRYQPQEGVWFAWYPVVLNTGQVRWFGWVKRFKALGFYWEYFDLPTAAEKAKREKDKADFEESMRQFEKLMLETASNKTKGEKTS